MKKLSKAVTTNLPAVKNSRERDGGNDEPVVTICHVRESITIFYWVWKWKLKLVTAVETENLSVAIYSLSKNQAYVNTI